ncbi:hypothetical protein LTR56_004345 [Elasticomyces elasticus]|nr:hypothetical protein LTR22_012073 [Elasticomyces elasticus]KAK3653933.1 hypothetical protein LTR56_004345 [Elasticomyces elasticus]KAK4917179.1 hypothetical protein LTR49_014944 [Elasticomyces elasticus]KAK5757091.1 hypothetical protein LTS12_012765 [Elasticomyces elasticus]
MDDSTMGSQSNPYYTTEAAGPSSSTAPAPSPTQEDTSSTTSIKQKVARYPKTHQCLQCRDQGVAKYLSSDHNLLQHFREKHLSKNERPYRCTECNSRFARPWSLTRHLEIHGITVRPGRGRGRRQTKNKTKQTRNTRNKNDLDFDGKSDENIEAGEERPLAISNEAYMAVQCYLCRGGFNNRGDVLEHCHLFHAVPQSVYCSCGNCTEDMRGQSVKGIQAQQQLKANGMVTIFQKEAPSMLDPAIEVPDFTLYGDQQNTTGHGAVSMNGQLADQYGSQMPTNYSTNGSAFGSSFQCHVADNDLEPTTLAGNFDAFGSLDVHNYAGMSGLDFNGGNTQEAFGGGEINEDVDNMFMSGMGEGQGVMNSGLYSFSSASYGNGEIV